MHSIGRHISIMIWYFYIESSASVHLVTVIKQMILLRNSYYHCPEKAIQYKRNLGVYIHCSMTRRCL